MDNKEIAILPFHGANDVSVQFMATFSAFCLAKEGDVGAKLFCYFTDHHDIIRENLFIQIRR